MWESNFTIWQMLEWGGAFCALIGSFIMATRRLNPSIPWLLWLTSNILYIALFSLHTHQNGMLLMHIGGLGINSLGFYQWSRKEQAIHQGIMSLLFYISSACILASLYFFVQIIVDPSIRHIEWIGSMLGLAAAFLLASRHHLSFLAWFIWSISNSIILLMSIHTQQYGILVLNAGFMITNIYGCWKWIKLRKELTELEVPLHP